MVRRDPRIVHMIQGDEGWSDKPYKDKLGRLTIGWGTLIEQISEEEGDLLFYSRFDAAEKGLQQAIPWSVELTDVRYAVLVNMAYQLGLKGLLDFKKMLSAMLKHDYDEAAIEMLDSKWSKQTPHRACRLAVMMRTNTWI